MPVPAPDLPAVEAAVVELTNDFRRKNRLGEVSASPILAAVARAYAATIARTGTFSHTADGREVGDRVAEVGYRWCSVAENLAMHLDSQGFETRALARKSVEGWINSPSHKAAMLAPFVTETGVGVVQVPDKNPKYVTVQVFTRPASLTYEFQISNASRATVTYSFGGELHEIEPGTGITHSACNPDALEFQSAGAKALRARFEAADGTVYTISPDATGGIGIDARPKARLD